MSLNGQLPLFSDQATEVDPIPASPPHATVEDLLPEYERYLLALGRTDDRVNITSAELRHFAARLGPHDVRRVTRADVRRFLRWLMRGRGNSPSTVNRKLRTLRGFFRYLRRTGRLRVDPTDRVGLPSTLLSPRTRRQSRGSQRRPGRF